LSPVSRSSTINRAIRALDRNLSEIRKLSSGSLFPRQTEEAPSGSADRYHSMDQTAHDVSDITLSLHESPSPNHLAAVSGHTPSLGTSSGRPAAMFVNEQFHERLLPSSEVALADAEEQGIFRDTMDTEDAEG
jgi:hypothetical protein